MTDTRAHPRYALRISAEVTLAPGAAFTSVTRDLSLGGVGLEHEQALPENSAVGLELFIVVDEVEDETTMPLTLRGRVAWCQERSARDFISGIQFVEMTAEQGAYLQKLLMTVSATVS